MINDNSKILTAFSCNEKNISATITTLQYYSGGTSQCNKARKEMRIYWKIRYKTLFVRDMVVHTE